MSHLTHKAFKDYDGCNGGMFWHEIISKKSKKLICQIGYGASINDIISDFSHWYLKIPTITTGESYDVNAEDERAFRRLLKKVYEYNVKNPI
jgi:hypothetical protein